MTDLAEKLDAVVARLRGRPAMELSQVNRWIRDEGTNP